MLECSYVDTMTTAAREHIGCVQQHNFHCKAYRKQFPILK